MIRKTWQDLCTAARKDATLHAIVAAVESGMPEREVLLTAVVLLAEMNKRLREQTEYALMHQRVVYLAPPAGAVTLTFPEPVEGVEYTLTYEGKEYRASTKRVDGIAPGWADLGPGHDCVLATCLPCDETAARAGIID